jgi:predicted permease
MPIFGIDRESVEGRATNVCCAFGNAGVVPLIFLEALFRNREKDILQKAFSQVSMYLLGWSPLFWSFGRNALLGNQIRNMSENDEEADVDIISSWRSRLQPMFPPPVVGVCVGIILASLPLLRALVMSSIDTPDSKAPFEVVFNCCQNLGRAANPVALLVLTSSLALGNSNVKQQHEHCQEGEIPIPLLKRWSCVSIARFILSPALMIALLQSLHKCGVIGSMKSSDSMIWFVLILEASMPCAQNSVLMLQVAEKPSEASRLARFLFTMYATSMVPVVIVSTILLEKCNFMV